MKRKILSAVLSATLVLSSFAPYAYADTKTDFLEDKIEMVSMKFEDDVRKAESNNLRNPVLMDFEEQIQFKHQENEKITFLVAINDQVMAQKYSMNVPDISQVRTESGLAAQIEYARRSQEKLIEAIENMDVNYDITETYDVALNGLAIQATVSDARKIAALPEIASVEVNRVIPAPPQIEQRMGGFGFRDASSNNMINVPSIGNKFNGKGQLIAVIDSGADWTHDVFTKPGISDIISEDDLKIKDEAKTNELVALQNLSNGKYFNKKIPFGYNYADKNQNIKESTKSSHGMHVAGIIAANTKRLQGVAPEAQIAFMRAFSENMLFGGTTPEIYNKAIDDAVKLGADSINMSLGATGTTDGRMEETTLNSLRRAQAAGVVVAIAIGNDGFMGFGALDGPGASNPDFGLTNSPAVADLSLAVASVDNAEVKQRGIRVTEGPGKEKLLLYMPTEGSTFPESFLQVVDAGHGYEDEIPEKVKGKVALIQRGDVEGKKKDFSFAEKIRNAQAKGAQAVIVYNNVDEYGLTHMAGVDKDSIPSCFISLEDGEYLKKNLHFTIKFETEEKAHTNPTGYRVSDFSSWGVSPEGNLKPDISAPGGQIESSINENSYQSMNGTSMATPHVAGGIAIAKQYVEQKFPDVQGEEKHRLVKNLLMSTATPHLDKKTKAYGSPRGQGAGLMNLAGVITSSVVIEGTNNISSINLRNIKGDKVIVTANLRNYADEAKTFDYYAVLNTDTVENGKIMLKPLNIDESEKQEITVGANSTQKFTVEFTLDKTKMEELQKQMPNGFFLEGFVFFEPKAVGEAKISVPFVGFKGEWGKLPVIDPSIYHHLEKGTKPYYYEKTDIVPRAFTHISSREAGEEIVLGEGAGSTFAEPKFVLNNIAFSPNGDGKADTAGFVGTFLRNYKDFEINVYAGTGQAKGDPIYTVSNGDYGIKNYVVLGPFGGPNMASTKSHWKWDGTDLAGLPVNEGQYTFEVKVKPDGKTDEKEQITEFPITIDNTFPRIKKSSYNPDNGEYKLEVVEEGSGIRSQEILIGKESYTPNSEGLFTLPKGTAPNTATLKIQDHARNTIQLPLDKSIKTGNERMVIVSPTISSGVVPLDKFKWFVENDEGEQVDPYNLAIGKYTLVVTEVDEAFEVTENKIPFEITENDFDKIVPIKFNHKNKSEVIITIKKPKDASLKVVLIDKQTGKEYFATSRGNSLQYMAVVPEGEYKITAREFDSLKYTALVTGGNLIVKKTGLQDNYPAVSLIEKEEKSVAVTLTRNGYEGNVTLVFRGQDVYNTIYKVNFAANESEKQVKLLRNVPFKIYVSDVEGYGIKEQEYTPHGSNKYRVGVELLKGALQIPVPIDKSDLMILINQVKDFNEKDYDAAGWEKFEIALDKAQKMYDDPSASQEAVDAMVKELQEAVEGLSLLMGEGNKELLKAKIDEAKKTLEGLNKEEYEEETITFLTLAIQGAELTYASKDPKHNTEKHINDTIDMLKRAIDNLKIKGGKLKTAQLNALIEESEELLKQKDRYTEDSVGSLEKALKDAKEVLKKANKFNEDIDKGVESEEDVTQEDIESIIIDIRVALTDIKSTADRSALKAEIDKAESIDLSQYELAGKKEFREALKKAKEVYRNKRALQSEINVVKEDLKQKREKLTIKTAFNANVYFKNREMNPYIYGKAQIENTAGGGYRYTIKTKNVSLELNGKQFDSKITKMMVNDREIVAQASGNMNVFTFELSQKASELNVQLTIDLMEELGALPIQETLVFS